MGNSDILPAIFYDFLFATFFPPAQSLEAVGASQQLTTFFEHGDGFLNIFLLERRFL